MKYIRTKDGIMAIISDTKVITEKGQEYHLVFVKGIDEICHIPEQEWKSIKAADTIEELCDEFVVEDRDEFAIFHNLKLAKQTKGTLYGAIWTDKGLIYVAKMNEKGCLELL